MKAVRATAATFELVVERDLGCCALCGEAVHGERGVGFSLHHRRPAGMGGDRRPETHGAGNLVLLSGSGTTGCHGWVESRRTEARNLGLLIPRLAARPPSQWRIKHAVHGWVYLLDDGMWEAA